MSERTHMIIGTYICPTCGATHIVESDIKKIVDRSIESAKKKHERKHRKGR